MGKIDKTKFQCRYCTKEHLGSTCTGEHRDMFPSVCKSKCKDEIKIYNVKINELTYYKKKRNKRTDKAERNLNSKTPRPSHNQIIWELAGTDMNRLYITINLWGTWQTGRVLKWQSWWGAQQTLGRGQCETGARGRSWTKQRGRRMGKQNQTYRSC